MNHCILQKLGPRVIRDSFSPSLCDLEDPYPEIANGGELTAALAFRLAVGAS